MGNTHASLVKGTLIYARHSSPVFHSNGGTDSCQNTKDKKIMLEPTLSRVVEHFLE